MKSLFKYIKFLFVARHTHGFGVHSPFVFDFLMAAVYETIPYYVYGNIEKFRNTHHIAADVSAAKGQLLFRTARYFNPKTIVEIGVRSGISTAYLAANLSTSKCYVFESKKNTQEILERLKIANVSFENNFEQKIATLGTVDLMFINSNISNPCLYVEKCLKNFNERSVAIIENPHSDERQWKKILDIENVTASIDLFVMGILFFDKNLNKKQYKCKM